MGRGQILIVAIWGPASHPSAQIRMDTALVFSSFVKRHGVRPCPLTPAFQVRKGGLSQCHLAGKEQGAQGCKVEAYADLWQSGYSCVLDSV